MNDRGSAVVGAVVTVASATLIVVSVLGLALSSMNALMIRDAAVNAASRAALSEAPNQNQYLMRMLESDLPHLASFEVRFLKKSNLVGFGIASKLPGIGFWEPSLGSVVVYAAKEHI